MEMLFNKDIILNTAGNLYWKDLKGNYLGCNNEMAKLFRLNSPEEIVGKTDADFFPNRKHLKIIRENDNLVATTGTTIVLEEEYEDLSGNLRIYKTTKAPLHDEKGKIIGIVGSSIEITREAQLQKINTQSLISKAFISDEIIANTAGNVFWKNLAGVYQGCNNEMAKLFRLNSPEEIAGKTDFDFHFKEEDIQRVAENDQLVISTGKAHEFEEVVRWDGVEATFLTKKAPLRDAEGSIIGIIGTSIDISLQKVVENAHKEFLSAMSHDIRTPFFGLRTVVSALLEREEDPQKKKLLGIVDVSAKRLQEFYLQIYETAKVGNFGLEKAKFNVKDVIQSVLELVASAVEAKNLQLTHELIDYEINSDFNRLHSILLNIISNAIKFSYKDGFIAIVMRKEENKLIIAISDSGIGIPSDKLDYIFERFTRVTPSYNEPEFRGTGSGLYIAREYAKDIGAKISVDSTLGKGSKFSVSISA